VSGAVTSLPAGPRGGDRQLFVWAAALLLACVFAGFARNYYLRLWFGTRVITPLVHAHGLLMSSWVALFVAQTWLIERGRIRIHRRLGVLGVLLAALAVAGAATVTLAQVVRRAADIPHRLLLFVAFDGVHLLVFAGLVTAALLLRRRGDIHKRLMLFATVSLLPPAFGRITGYFTRHESPLTVLLLMVAVILACVVADSLRHRRLHPAAAACATLLILSSSATRLAQLYA